MLNGFSMNRINFTVASVGFSSGPRRCVSTEEKPPSSDEEPEDRSTYLSSQLLRLLEERRPFSNSDNTAIKQALLKCAKKNLDEEAFKNNVHIAIEAMAHVEELTETQIKEDLAITLAEAIVEMDEKHAALTKAAIDNDIFKKQVIKEEEKLLIKQKSTPLEKRDRRSGWQEVIFYVYFCLRRSSSLI